MPNPKADPSETTGGRFDNYEKRHGLMCGLYVVAIILGVVQCLHGIWIGLVQALLCGALLPMRFAKLLRSMK